MIKSNSEYFRWLVIVNVPLRNTTLVFLKEVFLTAFFLACTSLKVFVFFEWLRHSRESFFFGYFLRWCSYSSTWNSFFNTLNIGNSLEINLAIFKNNAQIFVSSDERLLVICIYIFVAERDWIRSLLCIK